ncbi:MAG: hypothetical protein A2Y76_08410 [Planctomycetes bacterium RBG_13_60_9]|nr:MAG: hypothetical protein A2Y76_08410 [Planctomycetes bacterium RBG_13_60_9]
MLKDRSIAASLAMILFAAPAWAQPVVPKNAFSGLPSTAAPRSSEILSSPSAAGRFWEIAYELSHSPNVTGPQIDQAIILLTAARSMDRQMAGVEPLLLKLAPRRAGKDYSEQIILWLQDYIGETADRKIVGDAIRYLLSRVGTYEERKALLERVVGKVRNRNPAVDSDLATLLGLLMADKGDQEAAKFYLVQAYTNNKHNKAAFAKLAELAPKEISPAVYLEQLRMVVRENPLDIDRALAFAGYAERLQLYDVAAHAYQYAAEVFRYLYPSEPLPPNIYLPWAISTGNAGRELDICLQIAESVRRQKRFDILLEAIAGKAAAKMGRTDEAQRIFQQAELKAEELIQLGPGQSQSLEQGGMTPVRQVSAKQFAWFYCFANPNPQKAVDWANRAYSVEPNSPSAGALLAYALSISNQLEWAKPLLKSVERSQIVDLVQARILASEGKKAEAIQTLKTAIAGDPGSLAADAARGLLRQLGSAYTPPVDPNMLTRFLLERFGQTVIPQFVPPDQMMDVQFSVRGQEFSYGSELEGVIAVVNKGAEPLVVTDDSLFQGNIRVIARISGDITKEIPNLLSETIRTDLAVPPGRSLVHLTRLSTGELRHVLTTYPQASLDIQLTLYLDPVTTADGSINNRLVDVKPVTISIRRPGVQVTKSYVQSRFNAIASGQDGQKIQTAQLFTGMLKEQHAIAAHGTHYPWFKYADWLPGLLRSSLLSQSGLLLSEGPGDWVVKVHTMADMLSMPLDQELAKVLARNLHHAQWPVRLMTVYLLAKSSGGSFGSVLDWVAQNDANELVRSIAMSLQSASTAGVAPRPTVSQPPARLP